MKTKLLFVIVLIAIINGIHAQGVCFGIKGGLNLENITGLTHGYGVVGVTENESAKMTFGFHGGVFADFWLNEHWAIVPEILYTTGGSKKTIKYTFDGVTYSKTGTIGLSYIQFPVFVDYKFNSGVYLEAGPYAALMVGVTSNYTTTGDNGSSVQVISSSDTSNNNLDLGLGAGIGYRFNMGLGFNFRYNLGLTAVYKDTRFDNAGVLSTQPAYGKNGVLQFSISYILGCTHKAAKEKVEVRPEPIPQAEVIPVPEVKDKDVEFSIVPPNSVPGQRVENETLPMRDYVFFDAGSTEIPVRYNILSKDQARGFKEEQLQDCKKNPGTRVSRQLSAYYNVLNVVADRMRRHPSAKITLIGSSAGKGSEVGTANANAVKKYLVNTFEIDEARITVEGRSQPIVSSEYPNATADLNLTSAEDNRVDIVSASPDLMTEVKGNSALCLKPIEAIALDGSSQEDAPVVVNVTGAGEALSSWSVEVSDELGGVQNFGPFTSDRETISGSAILKDNQAGSYKIVLTGQTKTGNSIRKESQFGLIRTAPPVPPEQTFSILFEFDKSKTVGTYDNFLTNTVAPLIQPNSTVIINGHTDIVGEEAYNLNLSKERAKEAQKVLESAVAKSGKKGVVFRTNGFGESNPMFANTLPEERFYNRSVDIDISSGNMATGSR